MRISSMPCKSELGMDSEALLDIIPASDLVILCPRFYPQANGHTYPGPYTLPFREYTIRSACIELIKHHYFVALPQPFVPVSVTASRHCNRMPSLLNQQAGGPRLVYDI